MKILKESTIDYDNYVFNGTEIPPEDYEKITGLIIADNVTIINRNQFRQLNQLKHVTMTSVREIHECAFYGCNLLQSVSLGNCIEFIGESAFQECGLTSITIPESVTTIQLGAFAKCPLADGVQFENEKDTPIELGDAIFSACGFTEFCIPSRWAKVPPRCFALCRNLQTITYEPFGSLILDSYAFAHCDALKGLSLKYIRNLSDNSLSNCPNLRCLVDTEGVIELGANVFSDTQLETVVFTNPLLSIHQDAFNKSKIKYFVCESSQVQSNREFFETFSPQLHVTDSIYETTYFDTEED